MTAADEQLSGERLVTSLRALSWPILVLICGVTINRIGSFVPTFLILYLMFRGESADLAGLTLTAYGAGSVAGILLGGAITDRLGPKSTIAASMLGSGTLVGLIPFSPTDLGLIFVCLAAGVTAQLYRPAGTTMLAELSPPGKLVMTSAAYRLGLNVGAAIGPLIGALVIVWSFNALFILNMTASIGFGAMAWFLLPSADINSRATTMGSYTAVLRDHRYAVFVVMLFTISLVEIQYTAVLPLEVVHRALPSTVYSLLLTMNAAMVIALELFITRFVQNWPRRVSITIGIGLIGLGVSYYAVPGLESLFIATAIWTLGEIVAAPTVSAYPALVTAENNRGRAIALATGAQSIGYALGPAAGTFLWQVIGGWVWVTCAVAAVIAVSLSWCGAREPVVDWPSPDAK